MLSYSGIAQSVGYRGACTVRAIFWRKKNARLLLRLNSIVETTERARKSFQPPPSRVEIDTSYLALLGDRGQTAGPQTIEAEAATAAAAMAGQQFETANLADDAPVEFSIAELQQLAEQLDVEVEREQTARILAENRLEEALRAASETQRELDALKANGDLLADAERREAELRQSEAAARAEAVALRERTIRLEQDLRRELASRNAAAGESLAAAKRAAEADRALAALRAASRPNEQAHRQEAEAQRTAANRAAAEAQTEIASLRRAASEAAEAQKHAIAARCEAEASLGKALHQATAAQLELAALRPAAEAREQAGQREAEARRLAEQARADAAAQKELVQGLTAELESEVAGRLDAETRCGEAQRLAFAAQLEITRLRQAAELQARTNSEVIEAHSGRIADLNAELQRERTARHAAEAQREEAVDLAASALERATEATRAAASLTQSQVQHERDMREAAEAWAQEEALRKQAEDLRLNAVLRAESAELELAALRDTLRRLEQAVRTEAETRQHEEALRLNAEAQREEADRLAAEAQLELAALRWTASQVVAASTVIDSRETANPVAADDNANLRKRPDESRQCRSSDRSPAPISDPLLPDLTEFAAAQPAADQPLPQHTNGPLASPTGDVVLPPDAETPGVLVTPVTNGATTQAGAKPSPSSEAEAGADKRRIRRIASRMNATLTPDASRSPIACTIVDKSSSGAKIEFKADRFIDGISEVSVGQKLTLTFSAGQERTLVDCVVVWVAGSRCGVHFVGQFRTQQSVQNRRPSRNSAALEKALANKPAGPKFSAGRLAKSILSS